MDVESGKTDIVAQGEAGNVTGAQFSPDGKYLSYSRQDKLLRPHVWVKELATGQERMIGGRRFPAIERRQVDAGREEAAAHRRRRARRRWRR